MQARVAIKAGLPFHELLAFALTREAARVRLQSSHFRAAQMKFRPCIDLHDGVVKQIVGGSLKDVPAGQTETPLTNFVATKPAAEFASMYASDNVNGGHVIMLGTGNEEVAKSALRAYPGGLQVGGGVTASNALTYLEAGASHVIVTSFVFRDGKVDWERLRELVAVVGKDRLVLDLSCRKRRRADGEHEYVVVTDRWQKWTDVVVNEHTLKELAGYCSEFLVHGVDVEGMRAGVEDGLVSLLGDHCPIPCTYAGGVRNMEDVEKVRSLGQGKIDVSVGSALDIFGGSLAYSELVQWSKAGGNSLHSGDGISSARGSSSPAGAAGGASVVVRHDAARSCFSATIAGLSDEAVLDYVLASGVMDMNHTVVPTSFRGKGVAGLLADEAFKYARSKGYKVKATCSYISQTYLPKNTQYADLVAQ